MTPLSGIHHVAITVSSLPRSVNWYIDNLGFERAGAMSADDFDAFVLRNAAGLLIKLMQFRGANPGAFNERHIGLDHLAFAVGSPEDVDEWVQRLEDAGVATSGAKAGSLPNSRLVVFRDPDGVQLEIYSS